MATRWGYQHTCSAYGEQKGNNSEKIHESAAQISTTCEIMVSDRLRLCSTDSTCSLVQCSFFLSSSLSRNSHFCKDKMPYSKTLVAILGNFLSIVILFLILHIAHIKPTKMNIPRNLWTPSLFSSQLSIKSATEIEKPSHPRASLIQHHAKNFQGALKEDVVNSFYVSAQSAFTIPLPSSPRQNSRNLQFAVVHLPKENFDFQRQFASPYAIIYVRHHTPICDESVEGLCCKNPFTV